MDMLRLNNVVMRLEQDCFFFFFLFFFSVLVKNDLSCSEWSNASVMPNHMAGTSSSLQCTSENQITEFYVFSHQKVCSNS